MASITTAIPNTKRGSLGLISGVVAFWTTTGLVGLLAGLGIWPGDVSGGSTWQQLTLVGLGVAGLILAVVLMLRKSWARPAAMIYHIWLGGLLILAGLNGATSFSRSAEIFTPAVSQLPAWFDTTTWITLLCFMFFVVGVASLVLAYLLDQPSAWDAFVRKSLRPSKRVCPTCGATETLGRDGQHFCNYCGTTMRYLYFLQPVLKNARRILLFFEPGHARIKIGRDVGNGEAWIDTHENKRYRTISRHHADIELDFKSNQITLHKAFTSQEVLVDNQPVLMSAPVKLGSLIQLGKVPFIFGSSEYEPTLAYFVDQMDENKRYLLRFNGLDNEQSVGRARDNDVILAMPDIAHRHITILFDPEGAMFYVRNEAERSPVYIDGHLLEPGRTTELSDNELIIVQLGAHNFTFLPVLYQPKLSGL